MLDVQVQRLECPLINQTRIHYVCKDLLSLSNAVLFAGSVNILSAAEWNENGKRCNGNGG